MSVDLIMPSLGKPHLLGALESLQHLSFPVRAHFIFGGGSWVQAVNMGLERSAADVLLMDDDVRLLPQTFGDFDGPLVDTADIVGFKLIHPDTGAIQHAGGFCANDTIGYLGAGAAATEFTSPAWVCHVTGSLMYIKRRVLERLGRFSVWYGIHYEAADFCFRALKEGFNILYWPGVAIHRGSYTLGQSPEFEAKRAKNLDRLWSEHDDFLNQLGDYPKPI